MSPVAPFKYDAFISYTSSDRPWAKQLADDLTARHLTVFYDRTNLDIGDPWAEQLDDSLDQSQHLIVLWSGKSKSDYVEYERTYFHSKARPKKPDSKDPPRKEILILLEEPPPTVGTYRQIIKTLSEAPEEERVFDKRDINRWQSVVSTVEKTIRDRSKGLPILVAVLAATKASLGAIDFDRTFNYIGTMNAVITGMGIKSKTDLLQYYGNTPDEWCPFGNRANIWTVLDNLRLRVADATGNKIQIDWEPIGKNLWSTTDLDAAKNEATRLVQDLSLVVIDPISLVEDHVRDVAELIQGCFSNAQSAVMVLTPFRMLPPSASLRNIVRSRAMSFSTFFYQPPVPPSSPFANFGVNIGDEIDMNRVVLMALGQKFGMQKPDNALIDI